MCKRKTKIARKFTESAGVDVPTESVDTGDNLLGLYEKIHSCPEDQVDLSQFLKSSDDLYKDEKLT